MLYWVDARSFCSSGAFLFLLDSLLRSPTCVLDRDRKGSGVRGGGSGGGSRSWGGGVGRGTMESARAGESGQEVRGGGRGEGEYQGGEQERV